MNPTANWSLIPEHLRSSVEGYIEHREHPGDFLAAVASNDLLRAAQLADKTKPSPPEETFSAMILRMRGLADIHLDVRGGDIIVDLPGTSYTVTYHKPAVSPQLLAAYQLGENDPRTELTQAEFLARAGRLANDKARELDWIV